MFINHFPGHHVTDFRRSRSHFSASLAACRESILMLRVFILFQSHYFIAALCEGLYYAHLAKHRYTGKDLLRREICVVTELTWKNAKKWPLVCRMHPMFCRWPEGREWNGRG
jgi:hypothetical protein